MRVRNAQADASPQGQRVESLTSVHRTGQSPGGCRDQGSKVQRGIRLSGFGTQTDHPFGQTDARDMTFTFDLFNAVPGGQVCGFHPNTAQNRRLADTWSRSVARFVRQGDLNGPNIARRPTHARDRWASPARAAPKAVCDADLQAALHAYGAG